MTNSARHRVSGWIDAAIASRRAYAVCAVFIVCVPILLFWKALPSLSNGAAKAVPVEWEVRLGEHVLNSQGLLLKESKLSQSTQATYRERVLRMAALAGVSDVRVEFRQGVPNAYALPGNIMLLTDDLYKLMGDGGEEQSDAIVAHELGHMKHRHVLRMLMGQRLLSEIVLKMSGQSAQTTQVSGFVGSLVLNPKFSRQHEAEADQFAFELLAQNGQSPKLFAVAIQKLQFWQTRNKLAEGNFTSSHPLTDSRIEAAKQAKDTSNVQNAECVLGDRAGKRRLTCTIRSWNGKEWTESPSWVEDL